MTTYLGLPTAATRHMPSDNSADWRERAACRNSTDPDVFFAEKAADVEHAKAICATCPVTVPCMQGAVDRREEWGVWGGSLFVNGLAVRRSHRRGGNLEDVQPNPPADARPFDDSACGELAGYYRHRRRPDVPVCGPCRQAIDDYNDGRRNVCGTRSGPPRHRKRDEPMCEACAVYIEVARPSHSTLNGYRYHLQHGETPCLPCESAWRADKATRNAKDKAARHAKARAAS